MLIQDEVRLEPLDVDVVALLGADGGERESCGVKEAPGCQDVDVEELAVVGANAMVLELPVHKVLEVAGISAVDRLEEMIRILDARVELNDALRWVLLARHADLAA
eukprot:2816159-Rhodomonas_salina.1